MGSEIEYCENCLKLRIKEDLDELLEEIHVYRQKLKNIRQKYEK